MADGLQTHWPVLVLHTPTPLSTPGIKQSHSGEGGKIVLNDYVRKPFGHVRTLTTVRIRGFQIPIEFATLVAYPAVHSRLALAQFSQRQRPATGERRQHAGGIAIALCKTRLKIGLNSAEFSSRRGKSPKDHRTPVYLRRTGNCTGLLCTDRTAFP